jgi:hypothetical protein
MAKTDINGDPRYTWMDVDERDNFKDLLRSAVHDELVCIVDSEEGIIAYAIGTEHANQICDALGRDDA